MELKRVVITGLGTVNPLGNSIGEYWEGLKNGVSGAAAITRMDVELHKTKFACEVKNFDPTVYVEKKEVRKNDPYTLYAFAAAQQAIDDSGLDLETMNKDRAGVIWGAGIGGLQTFYEEVRAYDLSRPKFNPFFIPKMIANIAGGLLSIRFGFRGPNFTTVTACASASHAMIEAMNYIRMGKADVFITGGSEAAINEAGLCGFNSMRALSTRNDDPATASRPFDKDRDGFLMGEGAAVLVLEKLEHAVERGATILAEVLGYGSTNDAYHITQPAEEGAGAQACMREALADANIEVNDVSYINAHGTSTPLNDKNETAAIKNVFGEQAYNVPVSSTKSMIGHMLGASGAIEALFCVKTLTEQILPPTINYETPDPDCDLDYVPNKARKHDVNITLSNSFGFGGHNATIVLGKAPEPSAA